MEPPPRAVWTTRDSHLAFANERVAVSVDDVIFVDGTPTQFTVVQMSQGSAVVAVDDDSTVYLTREYRYALGRESVEVIGGASRTGESFRDTAAREAHEEAGIVARNWIDLGRIEPMTSNLRATSALWLATGLSFVEPVRDDPFERLEIVTTPLADAVRMALIGDIVHAPSCIALLRAGAHLGVF